MRKNWVTKAAVCGIILFFIGVNINAANPSIKTDNFNIITTKNKTGVLTATTWYVDDNSTYPGNGTTLWPYRYIWQAVENATHGDTIFVYEGDYDIPYSPDVIINKSIHLHGENRIKTRIIGSLSIIADSVRVSNVSIGSGLTNRGLYLETCNNCTIENCHPQFLFLNNSHLNKVIDCSFSTSINNMAIALFTSNNNEFIQNTLQADSGVAPNYGFLLENSNDNDILDNICKASPSAVPAPSACIWLKSSNKNQIVNNICSESNIGIQLTKSERNLIHYNEIKSNTVHGLKLEEEPFDNTITNNTIEQNFNGIWFTNTFNNKVKYNNIKDNDNITIYLSYSRGDQIQYNNIYSVVKVVILSAQFSYSSATRNYWYSPFGPLLRNFRLFFGFVQLRPYKHGQEYTIDSP